jgi:hypothetical protein
MASRSRTTFKKRQKEIARMEKQRDKAAKRMQRKADKAAGIVEPDDDMDGIADLESPDGVETSEAVESADSHTI